LLSYVDLDLQIIAFNAVFPACKIANLVKTTEFSFSTRTNSLVLFKTNLTTPSSCLNSCQLPLFEREPEKKDFSCIDKLQNSTLLFLVRLSACLRHYVLKKSRALNEVFLNAFVLNCIKAFCDNDTRLRNIDGMIS
jgi:hypothetical protein